jgi:hypothetical protein
MTTFDYASAQATATELIRFFGQNLTLRQRVSDGAATPSFSETDTVVRAVDLNVMQRFGAENQNRKARRTLYISTSAGVVPGEGDRVQIGSEWHTIEEVRPLNPGGIDLMYEADLED